MASLMNVLCIRLLNSNEKKIHNINWQIESACVCLSLFVSYLLHQLSRSAPFAGTKSKALTPQWDIMAKRVSDAGRPSASLQDEIHELD
ncbi:hypothetical protein CCH79_00007992 [Gambusia affinis]|uniref:Uncharacterized protein n=1 Tax=Gambusia affinis TaxID=33528 RepID=A0A315W383_GAMAF|nr:hypothetical protein CCH79_00007992 [Gambusia affinis]